MPDLPLTLDRAAGRLSGQIAAGLRGAIRSGRLAAGSRLPSSRDLAGDLAVSRGVVVAAYEQLTAEGFLTARRGDGTRVAPLAASGAPDPDGPSARGAAEGEPGTHGGGQTVAGPPSDLPSDPPSDPPFDLRLGMPDLGAFPRDRWLASMRTVLRTLPRRDLGYPDPGGVEPLRAGLAGYLGRVRAAQAGPRHITVVNGVAHGLAVIARLLAEDGRTTLAVEDPASVHQFALLEAAGLDIVRVPVDAEGIDVEALGRTSAAAVLTTPAHQFPTGVVLSPRRRAELIAWARATGGLVIEDDYDAEFRYDREPVGCVQGVDPEHVVLVGSVTKALAPALRLGWLVAPLALAERAAGHRARTDLGAPALEQHALAHLIVSGGYDRHLRIMRRRYRARRDVLAGALRRELPGCRVHGVSAGLHLYVELPPGTPERAVVEWAAERGVAVDGAAPMWSGPAPAPALVLGYARLGEARLAEAARLLGQAVRRTK